MPREIRFAASLAYDMSNTINYHCFSSNNMLFLQIIDEKSLIKKYQKEISVLKQELDQVRKGMLGGIHPEEIMTLKQKVTYIHSLYYSSFWLKRLEWFWHGILLSKPAGSTIINFIL